MAYRLPDRVRTTPRHRRPPSALPRVLRAPRLDHRAGRQPVNALLGSTNAILQVIEEHKPRAVVHCFGAEAAEYRTEAYPAYHAHRPPMPDGLAVQWAQAPAFWESFGWTVLDHDGLEADDLMHSLALAEERRGRQRADLHRRPRHVPVRHRQGARADAAGAQGLHRDGPEGGEGALRHRPRARPRLHRPARRPVRRPARREGHRREDGGRHPPAQGRPRARDPRRDPREALGPARADRAGGGAALLQGDRDAGGDRDGPRAGRPDGLRGRREGGRGARDEAAGGAAPAAAAG